MYHVEPCLEDLDRTEIHKLLEDDFEHTQTSFIFVVTGTYFKIFSKKYLVVECYFQALCCICHLNLSFKLYCTSFVQCHLYSTVVANLSANLHVNLSADTHMLHTTSLNSASAYGGIFN